jgi:hypothetical protein
MLGLTGFDVEGMSLYCMVGLPGHCGDAAVYALLTLKQQVDEGMLHKPENDSGIPGDKVKIHPYLVGDAALCLLSAGPHLINTLQLNEAPAASDPASAALS